MSNGLAEQRRVANPIRGATGRWAAVLSVADLEPGEMAGLEVGELRIAIYNIEGRFFATDNVCTHAFALLTEGWLEDGIIECPLHAGQFDVRTGRALGDPVTCDLAVFETRVRGDQLEIFIPSDVRTDTLHTRARAQNGN